MNKYTQTRLITTALTKALTIFKQKTPSFSFLFSVRNRFFSSAPGALLTDSISNIVFYSFVPSISCDHI
ncbi:hypothetical protein T4B_14098 [Trichinella pseudospiralis]|uniref:Uncharacterized protein n=1 Tax=Trichinella pseudospiralis TaxID=6337 RepID=A0A0V1JBX4_TRIPS|nr:hypothetical protein T4B_14098 [Trichinella pseudospiralis]